MKPHWLPLCFYFFLSSLFMLVIPGSHHMPHSLYYALILFPLLLLVWNPIKKGIAGLTIVLVVLFVTLHVTPLFPILQSHHQTSEHSQHPCCMPQVAAATVSLFDPFLDYVRDSIEKPQTAPSIVFLQSQSIRAPPQGI